MNKEHLLFGQALSMQWVAFALQKIFNDIETGGKISRQLLEDATSIDKNEGLNPLHHGSAYVLNFLLPFAIELGLKSLLQKEGYDVKGNHSLIDYYNKLSDGIKQSLQINYAKLKPKAGVEDSSTLESLLNKHDKDFVNWRYLDNAELLKSDIKAMHVAISAILSISKQKLT